MSRHGRVPATLTIDGETHTIAEWAHRAGLYHSTLSMRLARGMSPKEAITRPPRPRNTTITAFGETLTVQEWGQRQGISPTLIMSRIGRGMSPEEALTKEVTQMYRYICVDGVAHTIREWAEKLDITPEALRLRLSRGYSEREAVTFGFHQHRVRTGKRYTARGLSLTIGEWSARSGIKRETIINRLRRGWPVEEAVTRPPLKPEQSQMRKRGKA